MAQDKYSQNRQLAYDLLKQEGYTDIGDSAEELFKNKANSELAYQLLSQAGYTDIGKDYNEFASMLYGPQQPSRPTTETEQVEQVEQPAKPARQIDQAAAAEGRQAFQSAIASRGEVSTKEDIPQATRQYMAENPVKGGQRDYQRTQLVDQLNEAKKVGEPIIAEYEKRLQEYNDSEKELTGEDNVGPWLQSTAERKAWLDEHQQEYNDAKESIQMAEARLNYYDKPRVVEEIDAQIAKNQKHVAPKAISTTGTGYFPTQGAGYNMEESHNYEAANEILGMAKQTYQQGSKADPGYEGNGLEQVWTAARQFVEGGINNVDMGSLTYGLSEGSALIQARRVGDKYNKAIEKAGISEDDDMETAYRKAEKAYDSLTDGEKALLEALVEYSDAQIARQNDVSVASAAGAGAEQSAEFMLDFILTGGLEAVGKKAVGKLLRRQLGKKVKFGEQVLSDVATSALRTAVMLPRNLAAYGENLTQIDWEAVEKGTNEGKIPFARSHMNAALNTALTQYIEYWSEGFGEYFAAGEKKLFQSVTRKAPKTAIGKTLTQYRGSIGQFLDHGKFNGQFNEMLEEVVGSLFNSTAGWLSGDRVGDSDAIKEFWSGDNLATLFFSFLPMTAISTRTNIKAYNTMKEHYDNGVKVLNPFIENGAISQEDLNGLVSDIENKTPEEIVSKIEDITDKARKANGGFLPQNFAQALMGYCEGTFAMGMRNDAWEDSAEKMGVVNAYSQFYANPDERAAYDLSQAEQQAHDAAIQQGYSEEDLDQDAYILAQQALANEDPVLQQYAETKAAMSGLRDGFQKETEAQIAERENSYFNNVAVEKGGKYIMTRAYLNTPDALVGVFVVSPDITVNADGTISTPTGADGLVQYRKAPGYPIETAKASEFSDASTEDFNDWADMDAESFSSARNESFEQAMNTVSPLAKAKALYQMQGQNVIIEGSGAYEPVRVERLTHGGENVVISGDRDVLQGVAMAAGINSPGGTRLEIPVENIWDMLAKENDGSLSTEVPQGQPQQTTTAAPQSTTTQSVPGGATLDGRPIGDVRLDDENGWAYFTYQDDPDRMVQVMDINEFRQKTGQAQAPAAPEAPATPAAEVPKTSTEVPEGGTQQPKIPVDKDGNKIYDAPDVEPIDAYEDMYSTEGLSEADVDEWVISQSDEAEKNRNPKIKKGQSLQEWGKEKAEANRKADFWKELREVAEQHIREREEAAKREADLQAQIEKYGVDTRGFDLTPQTTEEAVAEYLGNSEKLIDLEDAKKETLGKSRSGRVPAELFRHLGNGGILTSKGGRTIQDVANDIVGEYEGTLAIAQDQVRDIIIDYLTRYTKSEMREMIFNNRLQAALDELEQQNGTEGSVEVQYNRKGRTLTAKYTIRRDADGFTHISSNGSGANMRPEEIGLTAEQMAGPKEEYDDEAQWEDVVDTINEVGIRVSEAVIRPDGTVEVTDTSNGLPPFSDAVSKKIVAKFFPNLFTQEQLEEIEATEIPIPASPAPASGESGANGGTNTGRGSNGGRKTGGNSVPSQGKGESSVPATAADIKNVAEARAFFEKQYGKGKRADNSVRVWELTHKTQSGPKQEEGEVSSMALNLYEGTGLSAEEASELVNLGTQLAEDFVVEDGFVKYPKFFKNLVETFGDGIRPFAARLYLGVQANVPDDILEQMDDVISVRSFDPNTDLNDISDEQSSDTNIQQGDSTGADVVAGGSEGEGGQGVPGPADVGGGTPGANEPGGDEGGSEGVAGEGAGESGEGAGESGGANGTGERNGGSSSDGEGGTQRTPGQNRGGKRSAGGTGRSRGLHANGGESGGHGSVDTEAEKEAAAAKAEQEAYEAEKNRIKDETDTNKLKSLMESIKAQLTGLTEKFDTARAKLSGQLRAIQEKLRELFSSNLKKSDALSREKVPYDSVSDPTGTHAIGSVVPSAAADSQREAVKRVEKEVGKPIAEFVREELGYQSLDEMFTSDGDPIGLSAEQVDAVGIAIYQIKTGRMLIVGDMTGMGKGRIGAALIRWGKKHGKKVLFVTESPNLFSTMYDDINDIGGLYRAEGDHSPSDAVPWIVNDDAEANITEEEEDGTKNVLVPHPNDAEQDELYSSDTDKLPVAPGGRNKKNIKGRQYDFVMMTYSQGQAGTEEEEGDSLRVKKKNQRNTKARRKLKWIQNYAKDAVVIMDESHKASGSSARGSYFQSIAEVAEGVCFMSATFAKTPSNMVLYAIRSSMNEAMITKEQLIEAIKEYGVPMQEILASALFKTGEMVRRERDFEGVKINWPQPEELFTEEEIETCRSLSDKTTDLIRGIIDFQRRYVNAIIRKLNEPLKKQNEAMLKSGQSDIYVSEYASVPYSGQVSNVIGMMLFAIKAKKAADMAIEQIKRGEKPVIAIDNTLGAYVDAIEGNIDSADFGAVLRKGLAFALRYQHTRKHLRWDDKEGKYKEVAGDRVVTKYDSIEEELGDNGVAAMNELDGLITEYGKETLAMDLALSPIDYIKRRIEKAGYRIGEITKRKNELIQNEDGTWTKQSIKHDKKDVIRRFNGGKAKKPLPESERLDAIIMNRSGATGNSLHASQRFGDQRPRKMIILQPAKDSSEEVQIRGRIDRTGQVSRGEYFYIMSPIPAEKKIIMMLRQKLASLDANSVGSEKVESNKVEAEDMDNKYGDEVAKDFLAEHPEINMQLDKPIKQKLDNNKQLVWVGRDGLLYDLLIGMQRMTCNEQELILSELEEAYLQKIEYLNQNGINDLATTTMDLDAVTVDSAIMIKGRDNNSISEFAHDTNIERVEVNVLRKQLHTSDVHKKMRELGAEKQDGTLTEDYGENFQQKAREAVDLMVTEKKQKQAEAEEKLLEDLKVQFPKPEGTSDESYMETLKASAAYTDLKTKNENDLIRYQANLNQQLTTLRRATAGLKPGWMYLVPLNDSEKAENRFGRFLGFKAGKDGRPRSVEAVFATKDSRAQVSIPIVTMAPVINRIIDNSGGWTDVFGKSSLDYGTDEDRMKFYDERWDKMVASTSARQLRYMITGNILQACSVLGKHRGTITTFTRKDPETGEITIDRGMLLAEDFDPENFVVRTKITKDEVWDSPIEFRDELHGISAHREGDKVVIKFRKPEGSKEKLSKHKILKDEEFQALCDGGEVISYSQDELRAIISEENAEKALDYLYQYYGFTRGHLLVMPDSAEKVDRVVYSGKSAEDTILELKPKYPGVNSGNIDEKIATAVRDYKMDVGNEELKTRIRELVQLRQAYLREAYTKEGDAQLAWDLISFQQEADTAAKDKPGETPDEAQERRNRRQKYQNAADAFKEELAFRGFEKGHLKHFKQGKVDFSEMEKTFKEFNSNPVNAELAKKVFSIVRKLNLDVFMNEKLRDSEGGNTGGRVMNFNWHFMNEDFIPDQLKADTILHEAIHTVTAYAFRLIDREAEHLMPQDLTDVAQELQSIYNAVWNSPVLFHQTGKYEWQGYREYGAKNVKEMLSEAGSNSDFREALKKIKLGISVKFGVATLQDVTNQPTFSGKSENGLDAVFSRLEKMIDLFNEHAYIEAYRGSNVGDRDYREADTPEVRRITAAELESTNTTLDRMSEELGIKVNKVGRSDMPKGHETDKGFYDTKTGEMTICMDNVTDERDAIATVLHETVGHHGLRQLFGDRFNDAMVRIYAALDANGKRWVNSYIARHPNADNIRAVEEYLSHLAESGNFKNTVWNKIKEIFGKIVDALFGTDGFLLTDNELNYILRASYEHLKNPDWLNTVQGKAFDTLLKRRLGINETDPNKPTDPQGPDAGRLYRDGDTGVANDDYNTLVDSWENKMLTENQDADRPVRIGMDKVMKEKGIKSISEDEDYVQRHNLASSRAESQAHEFELFKFSPLMDQVRAIQSRILAGTKATKATRQDAYERTLDYMYAVSGLERNNYKNAEIEAEKQNALAGVTDAAERAKIEKEYEAKKRDWSGITSLMGTSPANWKAAEAQARAMIANFEKAVGSKGMLDELWNRVRACTDYSLEHAYKYGLLTREEFERLHGTASQPRMWNYYLPLRGFSEMTAEEQFSYANFTNPSRNSAVVKKMNGRWTQADNPLANILNIAETEIVQGNDNWAKQALYRFTLNAGDNTLLSASEPWYVKDEDGNWSLAFPEPKFDVNGKQVGTETLEHFEERMRKKREKGEAKKGRQGLKLDNIMVNKAHRNEHAIHLKVGGIDKMIWVNGDPALARAVSGIGRAQNLQWLRRAGRWLSNLFTTYSLDFTAKNLIRDTTYSFIALHIKEDKAYRHQYYKNWIKNFGYGAFAFPMISLAAQWENGKLVQKEQNGTLTPRERDFLNFMRDGGQTGYTIINSVSQIKKDLEKQMRSAGGKPGTIPVLGHYAKAVKTLNEAFELLTRFTAYQTSRDMGRSGQRAASDAKEISVNFNRRGAQSGNGIWGNIAAYLGATHYFYNAGVQGFDNFLGLFKKKPGKMSAITAGFVMMGILTPLINSMLAGLAGGGDGDDDWYWNLPEWVRRNNLIIGTGKWYLAFPLPVEFRAPYGIGDIAGSAFCYEKYPNRHFGNVAGDILSTAAGILPVNPVEGYTGNGNLGDAALRAVAPDAGMFFVDWATNRDYTGRPLWKENPFSDTVPKSQGAYASTPKGIVAACQKLAEVSNGEIDIAPGLVRDFLQNYGGGFFRAAEDVSKIITGIRGKDPERPLRWDNVPFFSGFTGHIDEDRSNSFATNALYDYKKLSEDNVKSMNAILNTDDVSASILYDNPETLYERDGVTVIQKAKIKRMLDSKEYKIGKEYREGMNNKYKMKQHLTGAKAGQWYKSREIERKGVDTLRKEWKEARDRWASLPDKTEEQKRIKADAYKDVTNAWHLYYDAQGDLAVKLMNIEYNKEQ